MTTAIVPSERQAPAPMQVLTSEKIHPDNISREQAIMRAMALDNRQWKDLQRRRASLAKALDKVGYSPALAQYRVLFKQLEHHATEYFRLRNEKPEGWQESILSLREANQHTKEMLSRLRWKLKPLTPQARLLSKIDSTIAVLSEARERKKAQQAEFDAIKNEALIYHDLILSAWKRIKECHHIRYREGKAYYDLPQIERVVITPNTIYFKIFTTFKSYFGWKDMLPYNVYIQNVLSEQTMFEVAAATGREIKAIYPAVGKEQIYGYWYALNRTDTPNGIVNKVLYSEVMRWYPEDHRQRVTIPIGVGEGNKIKWVNFNDFPHWMIAGSTGTGKSNLLNVILCTLISHYIPVDLRIVAVDLKGGVELSGYEKVPHLLGSVVQSVDELAERLSQLEAEMAERFGALKRVGARDLYTHNLRSQQSLPRIIVIIDEFASTVDQGDLTKRVHNSILQLTSKGRAVGINILMCTQDPRVDIVPGKIKANCVVRIAGRTASTENSRIIIGSGEAAKIANVKGRMLLKIEQLPIEVQTPLILESDIEDAIKTAVGAGDAPPMALPEPMRSEQRWTPEKIIELSIKHLNGLMSARPIWEEVKESGITLAQIRNIVERIWEQKTVHFDGTTYKVEKQRNARYLIAVDDSETIAA